MSKLLIFGYYKRFNKILISISIEKKISDKMFAIETTNFLFQTVASPIIAIFILNYSIISKIN
jgi:hypothetical protein